MLYEIALTMIDGVGPVSCRTLLQQFETPEALFNTPLRTLREHSRLGALVAKAIEQDRILEQAQKELDFVLDRQLKVLFFTAPEYPAKLKNCDDAPVVLYASGTFTPAAQRIVSIVGTRNSSDYGMRMCEQIVYDLQPWQPIIVSGLALGIDSVAHRAAVDCGLETWAAVGHSLDRIYPYENMGLAAKIMENGAVFSEFKSGTQPDRENFPMRNRIVAGMADVTIVVETAEKGGSMITATLAGGYFRDVFAVPGQLTQNSFTGCHRLIRDNKAMIFTSVNDLAREMGWENENAPKPVVQSALLLDLTETEQLVVDFLKTNGTSQIDDISYALKLPVSKINSELLSMELKGYLKALPGKRFTL